MKIIFLPFLLPKKKILLIVLMKTFLAICFLTTFGFTSKSVFSQDTEIIIKSNKVVPVEEVFDLLKEQTTHTFIYRIDLFDAMPKVSLKKGKTTVGQLLKSTVSKLGYTVEYAEDGTILIFDFSANNDNDIVEQEQSTVSGTVTDPTGMPIPGVNVIEKGTSNGVVTDFDGEFAIEVAPDAVLIFSYLSYETVEMPVDGQNQMNITMETSASALEEVVVVGYGQSKRRNLTGSVGSIKASELEAQPINSFDQALQGRVAGVQVTQASNAPGGGISIRIRGGNSISASNDPLYVIDGFPITNPAPASGASNSSMYSSPLSFINPSDIVSVEVLKDASATAIYGSRGANGVVLVTTKRGKEGPMIIEFGSYYGMQKITRTLDILDAEGQTTSKNEQLINLGYGERYGDPDGNYPMSPSEYGEGTDWQNEVFRVAPIQNHQLTLSGGSEKIRYLISGNYYDQDGIVIASNFKRYTSRLNLDAEMSDGINVGTNFTVSRSINNSVNEVGGNSLVALALKYSPANPIFDENGNWQLLNVGPGSGFGSYANPVAVANTTTNELVTDRLLSNVYANIDLMEGLTARLSLGVDLYNSRRDIFYTPETLIGYNLNGYGSNGSVSNLNLLNENTITYTKDLKNHSFDLLGGITFQSNREERTFVEAQDFPNYTLGANNLGLANTPLPPEGTVREWGLNSYLSRINYRFMDKYLFTLTGRVDGSSRFGTKNKYAFFPSGAFAWRISDEDFLEDIETLSNLKFRVSYGSTGNDGIGLYRSLSEYNTARTVFNDIEVLTNEASRLANPGLKWEKTNQFNIGLDLGIVDNRFRFTTNYYIKTTSDLLLNVKLPSTTGFTSVLQNVGSIQNKGFEFSLNTINTTGAFHWTTNANISFNQNEVLSLANSDEYLVNSGFSTLIVREGEPLGSFYGNVFDGIWQSQEEIDNAGEVARSGDMPGAMKYKDIDGNGIFNESEDRTILGNGLPDFFYGITNNFSYKSFDLSIFFQGVQGNEIYNSTRAEIGRSDPTVPLLRTVYENAWRSDNPSNRYPAIKQWRYTNTSSNFVEDGSFVRLKNVTLGYSLLTNSDFFQSARIYISGQNLLTFTEYSGYDPEVNSTFNSNVSYGIDAFAYPLARTIMLGAKVQF